MPTKLPPCISTTRNARDPVSMISPATRVTPLEPVHRLSPRMIVKGSPSAIDTSPLTSAMGALAIARYAHKATARTVIGTGCMALRSREPPCPNIVLTLLFPSIAQEGPLLWAPAPAHHASVREEWDQSG